MPRAFAILLLSILCPLHARCQALPPKFEVRAVWITTANGLDWPRTLDAREQQAALRAMVRQLKDAHFNTIFFQVRARGDAYYHSASEPWAENLTGTLGKDPGWDPLAFLLDAAHREGMEVHAWFNVYKVRLPGANSSLPRAARVNPRWVVTYAGEAWLDPGIPEVHNYLLDLVLDLARNYPIDGINFDYVRYPGRDFADNESFQRYGRGKDRDEWRRANIDRFITEAYDRLTALKPMLKVGSSPLGGVAHDYSPRSAFRTWYQDAPAWLGRGKQDYISPQIYWNIGAQNSDPDFAQSVHAWMALSSGRHVYAGIGAYKSEVLRELGREIDVARNEGTLGQSFFRYQHVADPSVFEGRYALPALIPPMGWKDHVLPEPPTHLAVTERSTNVFQLVWARPAPAADRDLPTRYAVYRSVRPAVDVNDPASLVSVIPAAATAYLDTVRVPAGASYYYRVTSIDKGNNESAPSNSAGGPVREVLALKNRLPAVNALTARLAQDGSSGLVAYRLALKAPVTLALYRKEPSGPEVLLATLVEAVQEVGTYAVGLRGIRFDPGRYLLRLSADGTVLEETLEPGINRGAQ